MEAVGPLTLRDKISLACGVAGAAWAIVMRDPIGWSLTVPGLAAVAWPRRQKIAHVARIIIMPPIVATVEAKASAAHHLTHSRAATATVGTRSSYSAVLIRDGRVIECRGDN
jgi:hypothetical protein